MLATAAMAPAMGSCGGSDSPDSPSQGQTKAEVSVSPAALTAGHEAQTLELNVKGNTDWAIRADKDWVSLRPSGGVKDVETVVTVSVTANSAIDAREAVVSIVSGGNVVKTVTLTQNPESKTEVSAKTLTFGAQASENVITINSNTEWTLTAGDAWLQASPAKGGKGETKVTVSAAENTQSEPRETQLVLAYGDSKREITVKQLSDAVNTPEGYTLVWSDEFNEGTALGSDWTHEVQGQGWVNNELQNYVKSPVDGKNVTEVKDGFLNINCFKGKDGKVYSGRVYAKVNEGWTYGYVEARIKLPSGKGTWPAFWMMPVGNDWNTNPWPKCGEIDIMEEVGADPDQVSSSLHTEKYNHTKGTQKTHAMKCSGAEGDFHVYALEWTEDAITTYVDGKVQLKATKAEMGSDHDSWPFHYAFYPILNLAWGGDWGGYKGVDESALPVTMQVDYLRVFQKK